MSLLKSEPRAAIENLDELFALAHAMEHEAATRYAEIAAKLRNEGSDALAAVFERLSAEERGHLDSVVKWSEKERGRAPDPALVQWKLPETFDDEGAGTTDPRLLSAYRALSMAVRNEERAFAFWSYVVAHAHAPDIRQAAEAMAHEELDHVATLRRERRRAFHAERSSRGGQGAPTMSPADLETRLAAACLDLKGAASDDKAAQLQQWADEALADADALRRAPLAADMPVTAAADGMPSDAVALAELLVEAYLQAAEQAGDERAMARAQNLAGRAIARLAWLRSDLPEIARA